MKLSKKNLLLAMAIGLATLSLYWLIQIVSAPSISHAISHVPIGSRLADLDRLALAGYSRHSYVYRWLSPNSFAGKNVPIIHNAYGSFALVLICQFDEWPASDSERDAFTGEVRLTYQSLIVPDQLNPSFQIVYSYWEGILISKDVEQLPG
jgi:hypothetical protein